MGMLDDQTPEFFLNFDRLHVIVLNGLKNDPSNEFIGKVILKININCLSLEKQS